MGFDPCNHSLKIREFSGTPTPQNGSSLGSVSVHSHTLPHSRTSLLAHILASPCLSREPKARVATSNTNVAQLVDSNSLIELQHCSLLFVVSLGFIMFNNQIG
jgi:hypothetical protein